MSSVMGYPLLLTTTLVLSPFRSMVTSIRVDPQSIEFCEISLTQAQRQSA
jgi:hypothetical protein